MRCVWSCRATSVLNLMISNHDSRPTAIHLLAYFASSLPNINTLKLYFYTPAPVLPCRCGQIRRRCVSMCADAVDAVISHTA